MNQSFIKKAVPHIIAVIAFLIINCIYFSPQLQGEKVRAGDTISSQGMSRELRVHEQNTGERTLWTNSMFGGMPTYQIAPSQPTNVVKYVEKASNLFLGRPIGYFFAMMIAFYVMMLLLGVNPWLSMIGAVAFSLSTNNVILFGAGHMTKIRVFSFFGIMTAGMLLAFRKKYLVGAILFALGLAVCLYANHVQMVYYLFMTYLLYGIIELVAHARRGALADFGKAAMYLVIAGVVAVGSNASNLFTTYEYSKDTMRGEPILKNESNGAPKSSSNTKGLEWGYAMQYSNGFVDLFSSYIPGVAGGGGGEPVGPNSAFVQDIKKRGGRPSGDMRAPLYWGAVGKTVSTAGPVYFGAVMFFLFMLGLFTVNGSVKWWIGGGVLLTLLLSMGDNLEFFNRLFFDYFPMYNKFRTPNSIGAVTGFLVPILGVLAVSQLLKGKIDKAQAIRGLYISAGILVASCLFFALLGSSFFDFSAARDAGYESRYNYNLDALRADRASLMQSSAFRSLLLILAAAALIWAFLKDKIKQTILLAGLAVLTIGDLWQINKRYLGDENFVSKAQYDSFARPRKVDDAILKDPAPNFRVHDLAINTYNSSSTSYFHKTIGGYHPAKLQRYQDMIERHIQVEDQLLRQGLSTATNMSQVDSMLAKTRVLNMLNMKYVIANPDGNPILNRNALGNAWFVNSYKMVGSANEEIDALRGLNAGAQAIIHNEFQDQVNGFNPQKNGSIELTSYAPNHLKYKSNATSEQLAVFSEIWYGPNKGWEAYIDGEAADHFRANYVLRAMRVPAGEHTIEFKFEPSTYYTGTKITLVFSLLILVGFLWVVFTSLKSVLENSKTAEMEKKATAKAVKAPLKKTKSKRKKKG